MKSIRIIINGLLLRRTQVALLVALSISVIAHANEAYFEFNDNAGKLIVITSDRNGDGLANAIAIQSPLGIEIRTDQDGDGKADRIRFESGQVAIDFSHPHQHHFNKLSVEARFQEYRLVSEYVLSQDGRGFLLKSSKRYPYKVLFDESESQVFCSWRGEKESNLAVWRNLSDKLEIKKFAEDQSVKAVFDPSCGENVPKLSEALGHVLLQQRSGASQGLQCLSNIDPFKSWADEMRLKLLAMIRKSGEKPLIKCTDDMPSGRDALFDERKVEIKIKNSLASSPELEIVSAKLLHEIAHWGRIRNESTVQEIEQCCGTINDDSSLYCDSLKDAKLDVLLDSDGEDATGPNKPEGASLVRLAAKENGGFIAADAGKTEVAVQQQRAPSVVPRKPARPEEVVQVAMTVKPMKVDDPVAMRKMAEESPRLIQTAMDSVKHVVHSVNPSDVVAIPSAYAREEREPVSRRADDRPSYRSTRETAGAWKGRMPAGRKESAPAFGKAADAISFDKPKQYQLKGGQVVDLATALPSLNESQAPGGGNYSQEGSSPSGSGVSLQSSGRAGAHESLQSADAGARADNEGVGGNGSSRGGARGGGGSGVSALGKGGFAKATTKGSSGLASGSLNDETRFEEWRHRPLASTEDALKLLKEASQGDLLIKLVQDATFQEKLRKLDIRIIDGPNVYGVGLDEERSMKRRDPSRTITNWDLKLFMKGKRP